MIPANQLRPGNLIIGNTGIETVRMVHGHEGYKQRTDINEIYKYLIGVEENRNQYNLAEIKPVPLSEELLIKAGGEAYCPNSTYLNEWDFNGIHFYFEKAENCLYRQEYVYNIGREENNYEEFGPPIYFMHRFQNLFLELSNTELKFTK